MLDASAPESSAGLGREAFTLIEIVVALTIIAVIAAVAIPTIKGLNDDERAREPVKILAELVQEVRHRAMRDGRSYQIVFEREGIHASRTMFPYEKRDEFLKHLEEMRKPPLMEMIERVAVERIEVQQQEVVNGRAVNGRVSSGPQESTRFEPPWTQTIPLELGTECEVLMWGDGEWDVIEGEKMRRWVFRPTGMANPARVRLRTKVGRARSRFRSAHRRTDARTDPSRERRAMKKEHRTGAYVLLEIIIALTVFAVVATGLASVLHSSLDSANLLRRQAAIRRGLESILVEAKAKPKREEMPMKYRDDALGVEFHSELHELKWVNRRRKAGERVCTFCARSRPTCAWPNRCMIPRRFMFTGRNIPHPPVSAALTLIEVVVGLAILSLMCGAIYGIVSGVGGIDRGAVAGPIRGSARGDFSPSDAHGAGASAGGSHARAEGAREQSAAAGVDHSRRERRLPLGRPGLVEQTGGHARAHALAGRPRCHRRPAPKCAG